MYANDLTIYYRGSSKDITGIVEKMNADLQNLTTWARLNGLVINASKTQAIWFGVRTFMFNLYAVNPPNVYIVSQPIEVCREIKLLGCTLDSMLSFTQHCTVTNRKAFATLSKLRKCSHCLPKNAKLLLIKSLVLPYFDYAAGLLLNHSRELCLKRQRCLKAAVDFVVGLENGTTLR